MVNPPKAWKAEYAKSARSLRRTCKNTIEKEVFRLGKIVQSTQFDGFMPMGNHASCILRKAKQIKSLEDVEAVDQLRWEDQQKIREYIDAGGSSSIPTPAVMEGSGSEVSQTSRASCRQCNQKIVKEEVRISSKSEGAWSLAWHHAKCFSEISSTTQVEKLSGWYSLSAADQAVVLLLFKSSASTGNKTEPKQELAQESTFKAGAKRKKPSNNSEKSKLAKAEADVSASKNVLDRNGNNVRDEIIKASELESQLEAQTKALWALKDDLKSMSVQENCERCLKLMNRNLQDQSLICAIAVPMGCFLEFSLDVLFVQDTFDIQEACIDAVAICQNGASVLTLPLI